MYLLEYFRYYSCTGSRYFGIRLPVLPILYPVSQIFAYCSLIVISIQANTPDLGRFFRYWNKARKSALRPQGI